MESSLESRHLTPEPFLLPRPKELNAHPASAFRVKSVLARLAAHVDNVIAYDGLGILFRDPSRPSFLQVAYQLGGSTVGKVPALLLNELKEPDIYAMPVTRVMARQEAHAFPPILEMMRLVGAASIMSTPIYREGQQIARLVVSSASPVPYQDEEGQRLESIASNVSDLVAQLIAALTDNRGSFANGLESLLELNNRLVASRRLAEYGPIVADHLHQILPESDYYSLGMRRRDEPTVHVRMYTSPKPEKRLVTSEEVQLRESYHGWVIEHRAPLLLDDIRNGPPVGHRTEMMREQMGIQSVCYLPMLYEDECLGAIGVASRKLAAFRDADLSWFRRAAHQIAVSLRNGLAYDELRASSQRLLAEKRYLEEERELSQTPPDDMVVTSREFTRTIEQASIVAATNATVLILGETGTGKELIARLIHRLSRRANHTLVKLNCAAIPTGLLESDLFGHEKGSFTGAVNRKVGRMELAHEGTLFLDEVGDIPLEIQPKLLRALQENEFERLGSVRTQHVDIRLIAATNRDLSTMVENREFRSDLFYRLNVFPIRVPPLRERLESIEPLAYRFMERYRREMGKSVTRIAASTLQALRAWHWPGNVRELENLIERAVILSTGDVLELSSNDLGQGDMEAASATLEEAEREHIERVLRETQGVIAGPHGAAKKLGLKRTTLQYKIRKLGINRHGS